MVSFILPGNSATGGYEVANSLRLNDGDSAYLNFTPSSTGSRRIFTISFWFKQTNSSATRALFSTGDYSGGDGFLQINLSSSGRLVVDDYDQGGSSYNLRWVTPTTGPLFRDPAAWYHFVLAVDSTQGTQSNRVKVYINGVDISSDFTQTTNTSQNDDFHVNTSSKVQQIGRSQNNNNYYDGYLAEFVMIDGSQLTPTSFGEFDEDSPTIWKPKDVSGLTFGTNGFYLDFEDSSSLGNDAAGSNNFTANNLAATDQSTDTCTNNFATMNPLDNTLSAGTFSEGNLKIAYSGSNGSGVALTSTFAVTQGKWYFEVKLTSTNDTGNAIGITDINAHSNAAANRLGLSTYSYAIDDSNGKIYNNNDSGTSYGSSYAAGDIMGVYLDLDNNKLYISEDGTLGSSTGHSITAASSVSNGHYFFAVGLNSGSGTSTFECNFGGCPAFSISSGNTDDNGYGNFEYSPNITGDGAAKKFYALNTKNLAEFG